MACKGKGGKSGKSGKSGCKTKNGGYKKDHANKIDI